MRFGEFDRSVDLQSASISREDTGEETRTWSTYAAGVKARKLTKAGTERVTGGAISGEVKATFKTHRREDVTRKHRLVDGSDVYDIVQVEEIEQRKGLFIHCVLRD